MPFEIVTVPCLSDNYAFILHETGSGLTAVIDAPDAAPIIAELGLRDWVLDEIWLTHHHDDHIQGVDDLKAAYPNATITGGAADAHRLPALDRAVDDGDAFDFAGSEVTVMDVSGHTVGHIAFYVADARGAFTGDSLMAMGCGRVFEGTFPQMWDSLSKLAALPPNTIICSGHEYTSANARFAQTIEPENSDLISRIRVIDTARAIGEPTVPSRLSDELATNPFLRASEPSVKSALNMENASDSEVFGEIRRRKDAF
ncbi:MAG: hydroxyacylglutathione hydrolase [Rhodobacteraceae bacterium]|nr:hydroxyacylglutathione hydrolase [Paracoccaceae bacterium]